MRRMTIRQRAVVVGIALAFITGCTSTTTPVTMTHAKGPAAPPVLSVQALCARTVPGSQHAVPTTVGKVRHSGLGVLGPSPRVLAFAPGESDGNRAAFCYRWLPARQADEWWGVSDSGGVVHIGGFGGVKRDLGVFDGGAFD